MSGHATVCEKCPSLALYGHKLPTCELLLAHACVQTTKTRVPSSQIQHCVLGQGINVRQRAAELVSLLSVPGKLQAERDRVSGRSLSDPAAAACCPMSSLLQVSIATLEHLCNGASSQRNNHDWGSRHTTEAPAMLNLKDQRPPDITGHMTMTMTMSTVCQPICLYEQLCVCSTLINASQCLMGAQTGRRCV